MASQRRPGAVGLSTGVLDRRGPSLAALVVAVVVVFLAPIQLGGVAEAKRKHKRYCTKSSHPIWLHLGAA